MPLTFARKATEGDRKDLETLASKIRGDSVDGGVLCGEALDVDAALHDDCLTS